MMTTKVIIFVVIVFLLSFFVICNNITFLSIIACGSDIPSNMHYWAFERILKKFENTSEIDKNILDQLLGNKNCIRLQLKLLGLIGTNELSGYIFPILVEQINNGDPQGLTYNIINCLGLTGDESVIPFLEYLLKNYDKYNIKCTEYSIARALYLLSGKSYTCVTKNGVQEKFIPTVEQQIARGIILSSFGRKRTFEEMIALDRVFRQPGW